LKDVNHLDCATCPNRPRSVRACPARLAALGDGAIALTTEDLCGGGGYGPKSNLRASDGAAPEMPKTATPSENLAVLANGQDFCGAQQRSAPKTATRFCRDGLSHAAAQQNAVEVESYETSGSATAGSALPPTCCECGAPIDEHLPTSWGGRPCHRACGEAAFEREKARRRVRARAGMAIVFNKGRDGVNVRH
jgi:hypothetical protein